MTAPKFKRLAPGDRAAELVEAGLRVLAKGGITAFTIDNICKASGASRGLVGHHFGGKDGLLAACYAAAYAPLLQAIAPEDPPPLAVLLDELLSDRQFRREGLNIWLALWGEIAVNPALRAEHLRQYDRYHRAISVAISGAIAAEGADEGEADRLASGLIALLDGLWVEMCIAPDRMDLPAARKLVEAFLAPHVAARR